MGVGGRKKKKLNLAMKKPRIAVENEDKKQTK